MIDSVCLTLPIRMHRPPEMAALGFRPTCHHQSPACSHPARWHLRLATKPKFTWSEAPNGSDWLSVSGSLPKFMFGSNVRLFTNEGELKTCLEVLSEFVSNAAQVRFDAFAANVTRVDYCHDWLLSDKLPAEYLWAIREISLPRMTRHLIDNSTVELSNASQTIVFYDKFEEKLAMTRKHLCPPPDVEAARGTLRLETRFRDNRSCQRHAVKMGAADRKAKSILTANLARQTIADTLQRLGLNKPLRSGALRYQLLRHYCGDNSPKYVRLAGFLTLSDLHGAENLVPLGIFSYSDFRRKLAEVKEAGAFFQGTTEYGMLPALELPNLKNSSIQAA